MDNAFTDAAIRGDDFPEDFRQSQAKIEKQCIAQALLKVFEKIKSGLLSLSGEINSSVSKDSVREQL